jgi:hypothetical protein
MTNMTTELLKEEFAKRGGVDTPAAFEDVLAAFSREDFKTLGEFHNWLEKRPHLVAKVKSSKALNPWSEEGWNTTAQGAIFRGAGGAAQAASLAKAAGSYIGATKPNNRHSLLPFKRGA